jgi:hypothetical protein
MSRKLEGEQNYRICRTGVMIGIELASVPNEASVRVLFGLPVTLRDAVLSASLSAIMKLSSVANARRRLGTA